MDTITRLLSPGCSLGIDLSEGDGEWDAAKSKTRSISVATIRATWNKDKIDSRFATNWLRAQGAGIRRLAYHWFVPRVDAVAQACHFVTHSETGDYPRMLDLEDSLYTKAYYGIATEIKKFLDMVESLTGERCIIYTNRAYSDAYLRRPYGTDPRDYWLNQYPLVVASWGSAAPSVPYPWFQTQWMGWQFTGTAHGPSFGVQGLETSLYAWNG